MHTIPLGNPPESSRFRWVRQLVGPLHVNLQGKEAIARVVLMAMPDRILRTFDKKITFTLGNPPL